jgi:lysozyme
MRLSEQGQAFIKRQEGGPYLIPYKDSIGLLTIGWGHRTSDISTITGDEADIYFLSDVTAAEAPLNKMGIPLDPNQWDALTSFIFNVGVGKPGMKDGFVWLKSGVHSSMYRYLLAGQKHIAAEEFDKWNHAGGKVIDGLTTRRAAEKALFLYGKYTQETA